MPLFAFVVPAVVTYGTTAWCIVGPVVSLEPLVLDGGGDGGEVAAYTAGLIVIGMLGVRRVRRREAELARAAARLALLLRLRDPELQGALRGAPPHVERLASHPGASERHIVVLAMEVREGVDGLRKVRSLARAFPPPSTPSPRRRTRSARRVPGEGEQRPPAAASSRRLCAGLRIPPSNVVVTVLDADRSSPTATSCASTV